MKNSVVRASSYIKEFDLMAISVKVTKGTDRSD